MNLSRFVRPALTAASLSVLALALVTNAEARTRWKVHSAFGKAISIIGTPPPRIAEDLEAMSGGEFQLQIFEPGALVPGTQYYDAVSEGSIDAAWGTPGYNVSKGLEYAFFSAVPFGPGGGEYLAWMYYGGGLELAEELYAQNNIKFLLCGMIPPESSGWFRNEVTSLDSLRGLKMRFFGLGAQVMEKFGVSTQLLAGGDIYPALELGTIDATEFSMPVIDKDYGFYQIAKHNYFPGWHQQSTLNEFLVNMDKWNELSDPHKAMLEVACRANITRQFAEGEATQSAAMKFHQDHGVTIHQWPPEMLAGFEKAWEEVIAAEVEKSELAKKIWDSYSTFREEYQLWREHGYLQ